jgi:hypothetical protein
MTNKRLTVELGRSWTAVSGRDAYPLLVAVGARPLWSAISRAWMGQRHSGQNVIALAEERNYVVEVREGRATPVAVTPRPIGRQDPAKPTTGLLW